MPLGRLILGKFTANFGLDQNPLIHVDLNSGSHILAIIGVIRIDGCSHSSIILFIFHSIQTKAGAFLLYHMVIYISG